MNRTATILSTRDQIESCSGACLCLLGKEKLSIWLHTGIRIKLQT